MPLCSRRKADLVLALHFAVVIYAVTGGLLAFFLPWSAALHLPIVLWSGVVNLAGWTCPLTPLEKHYLQACGHASYQGSFTERYLRPLIYPKGMPRHLEIVAGVTVLAWNALVYLVILYLNRPAPA